MRKKYDIFRFALKCLLFPAAAILIIYCLNKPYKKINDAKYQDVLKFSTLGTWYTTIEVGNLGSSHGAYDFNYDSLTECGYECFNFANTSQSYDYDYAVLKEYIQYMSEDSIMLIPVSYFSFNNEVVNENEAEAMSLRYYHFLSPKNIPNYDPYIDITTNKLPILSAGEDIIKLLPDFKLSLIALAAEDNGIDMEEFTRRAQERYSRHFDNKEEYFLPERIQNLYDIINYCKEHDITPILITPPFSSYYQDLVSESFLQEFQNTINAIASGTDVEYYDYSCDNRFRDNLEYFMDADHLTEEGAAYFMEILINEIPKMHELVE